MSRIGNEIHFRAGLQESYNGAVKDINSIYFATDTHRLFIGEDEYTRPVQHGANVPLSKQPLNSLFVKENGTARELYYSKDGISWDLITYLPAEISGGIFGNNVSGTVSYGGTIKIPKVTIDNHGFVTSIEDINMTLPASDKIVTVTSEGAGNAVTNANISADGATLTITKGGNFIPITGGTFTGPVTLAAAPEQELQPATKQYVDDAVSSPSLTSKYLYITDDSNNKTYRVSINISEEGKLQLSYEEIGGE